MEDVRLDRARGASRGDNSCLIPRRGCPLLRARPPRREEPSRFRYHQAAGRWARPVGGVGLVVGWRGRTGSAPGVRFAQRSGSMGACRDGCADGEIFPGAFAPFPGGRRQELRGFCSRRFPTFLPIGPCGLRVGRSGRLRDGIRRHPRGELASVGCRLGGFRKSSPRRPALAFRRGLLDGDGLAFQPRCARLEWASDQRGSSWLDGHADWGRLGRPVGRALLTDQNWSGSRGRPKMDHQNS